jgi:hypothetical protein
MPTQPTKNKTNINDIFLISVLILPGKLQANALARAVAASICCLLEAAMGSVFAMNPDHIKDSGFNCLSCQKVSKTPFKSPGIHQKRFLQVTKRPGQRPDQTANPCPGLPTQKKRSNF